MVRVENIVLVLALVLVLVLVLVLIKIYTVLALIKIYTVPVGWKILMSFCYVVRCKAADFIN